jgi:hypothetical protein
MSTTVRIREADKQVLDELQARIRLESGERVPLEEVLHRVLDFARDHEDELVDRYPPPDLSDEELERIMEISWDFGEETREEDIDETLYGGEDGPA